MDKVAILWKKKHCQPEWTYTRLSLWKNKVKSWTYLLFVMIKYLKIIFTLYYTVHKIKLIFRKKTIKNTQLKVIKKIPIFFKYFELWKNC